MLFVWFLLHYTALYKCASQAPGKSIWALKSPIWVSTSLKILRCIFIICLYSKIASIALIIRAINQCPWKVWLLQLKNIVKCVITLSRLALQRKWSCFWQAHSGQNVQFPAFFLGHRLFCHCKESRTAWVFGHMWKKFRLCYGLHMLWFFISGGHGIVLNKRTSLYKKADLKLGLILLEKHKQAQGLSRKW